MRYDNDDFIIMCIWTYRCKTKYKSTCNDGDRLYSSCVNICENMDEIDLRDIPSGYI